MAAAPTLEVLLGDMLKLLPVGFVITLAMSRTDSGYVAHAALHTQEPDGTMLLHHVGADVRSAIVGLNDGLVELILEAP